MDEGAQILAEILKTNKTLKVLNLNVSKKKNSQIN